MSVDPSLFKAYDIRGIYPDPMTEDAAYKIGASLTTFLKPRVVAVGRDMRLSSDQLFAELARGITEAGADVHDLGLVSTDALYFAVGRFDYDAGVMITASHNPKDYNGFKICREKAIPLSGQEGLNQMQGIIRDGSYARPSATKGKIVTREVLTEYAEHCLSFIDIKKIRPYKIVIDAGNGMAGHTLPPVLAKLPAKVTPLYFELDGRFPNHPASPIELENLVDLQKKIAETGADFGVAFDGDADRMFLVDKFGTQLGGDMVTALVAKSLLKKHPGETILYNLICSRAVPELITKMGGKAIRTRVGHALIKPLMKEHNAIFGGEHSGHFYFRDFWFADSGLIAFLVCLELISEENIPLHDLVKQIDPYVRSGEINSKVASIPDRLNAVADAFSTGQVDMIDGLTVQYEDWWFNLRPSNTEPLLRLNVEAANAAMLKQKVDALLAIIRS